MDSISKNQVTSVKQKKQPSYFSMVKVLSRSSAEQRILALETFSGRGGKVFPHHVVLEAHRFAGANKDLGSAKGILVGRDRQVSEQASHSVDRSASSPMGPSMNGEHLVSRQKRFVFELENVSVSSQLHGIH